MFTTKRAFALLSVVLAPLAGGYVQKAAAEKNASITSARGRSAAAFAAEFIGVTNEYAKQHGRSDRVSNAHCVQAAPGRYMCSYVITRNGRRTCHVMQASWRPQDSSAITITLAGRTDKCDTLRDALRGLH